MSKDFVSRPSIRPVQQGEARSTSSQNVDPVVKTAEPAARKLSTNTTSSTDTQPRNVHPGLLPRKTDKNVSFDGSADRNSRLPMSKNVKAAASNPVRPEALASTRSFDDGAVRRSDGRYDSGRRGNSPVRVHSLSTDRLTDNGTADALEHIKSKSPMTHRKAAGPPTAGIQRGTLMGMDSSKTITPARPAPPPAMADSAHSARDIEPISERVSNTPEKEISQKERAHKKGLHEKILLENELQREVPRRTELRKDTPGAESLQEQMRRKEDARTREAHREETQKEYVQREAVRGDEARRREEEARKEEAKAEEFRREDVRKEELRWKEDARKKNTRRVETCREETREEELRRGGEARLVNTRKEESRKEEVASLRKEAEKPFHRDHSQKDEDPGHLNIRQGVPLDSKRPVSRRRSISNDISSAESDVSYTTHTNVPTRSRRHDRESFRGLPPMQDTIPRHPFPSKRNLEDDVTRELQTRDRGPRNRLIEDEYCEPVQETPIKADPFGMKDDAKLSETPKLASQKIQEQPSYVRSREPLTAYSKPTAVLGTEAQGTSVSSTSSNFLRSSGAPSITSTAYDYPSDSHQGYQPAYPVQSPAFSGKPRQSTQYTPAPPRGFTTPMPYPFAPHLQQPQTRSSLSARGVFIPSVPGSPVDYHAQPQAGITHEPHSFAPSPPAIDPGLRARGIATPADQATAGGTKPGSLLSSSSSGHSDIHPLLDRHKVPPCASEGAASPSPATQPEAVATRSVEFDDGGSIALMQLDDIRQQLRVERDRLEIETVELRAKQQKELDMLRNEHARKKERYEKEAEDLRTRVRDFEDESRGYSVERERLQREIEELRSKRDELQGAVQNNVEEREALQLVVNSLQKKLEEIKGMEQGYVEERDRLQEGIEKLQDKQQSFEAVRADNAAERDSLLREINELQKQADELSTLKKQTNDEGEGLKNEIEELREKEKAFNISRARSTKEQDRMKLEIESLTKKTKDLTSQLNISQGLYTSLQNNLGAMREHFESVSEKHEDARQEFTKTKLADETTIKRLEARAAAAEGRVADLEIKMNSLLKRSEILVHEHDEALRTMSQVKEEASANVKEMTDIKDFAEREKIRLAVEFERLLHEAKEQLKTYKIESYAAFARQKAELKTSADAKLDQMETAARAAKEAYEKNLISLRQELEVALTTLEEKENLVEKTGQELVATKQLMVEEAETMKTQHNEEKLALEMKLQVLGASLENEMENGKEIFQKEMQQQRESFEKALEDTVIAAEKLLTKEKASVEKRVAEEKGIAEILLRESKEAANKLSEGERLILTTQFNEAKELFEIEIFQLKEEFKKEIEERKITEKQLKDDKDILEAKRVGDKSTAEKILQEQKETLDKVLQDQKKASERQLAHQTEEWDIKAASERLIADQLAMKALDEVKAQHTKEKEELEKRHAKTAAEAARATEEKASLEISRFELEKTLSEERKRFSELEALHQQEKAKTEKSWVELQAETLKTAESEKGIFQTKIAECERQLAELGSVKSERAGLEKKMQEQEAELIKISELKSQVLRSEIRDLQKQLKGKDAELTAAAIERETQTKYFGALIEEKEMVKNENLELEKKLQERESELHRTAQLENNAMLKKNEDLLSTMNEEKKTLDAKIKLLQAKWQEQEAESLALAKKNIDLETRLNEREAEIHRGAELEREQTTEGRDGLHDVSLVERFHEYAHHLHKRAKSLAPTDIETLSATIAASASQEVEELRKQLDSTRAYVSEEKNEMETRILELQELVKSSNEEKDRLTRFVNNFRNGAGKANDFYIDAFDQLRTQVRNVASKFCTKLPEIASRGLVLAPEHLKTMFYLDTTASQQIRAAFVTYIIYSVMTTNIFTSFAFALGKEEQKLEELFCNISSHLGGRDSRKEAVWRRLTLDATLRGNSSKENINANAASIVVGLTKKLNPFVHDEDKEMVSEAVAKIIKQAFKTWRLARIEKEVIIARMPGADEFEGSSRDIRDLWLPQVFETSRYSEELGNSLPGDESPRMLLGLSPLVERAMTKEESYEDIAEASTEYFLLSKGTALYSDAPPILVCEKAVKHLSSPCEGHVRSAKDIPDKIFPMNDETASIISSSSNRSIGKKSHLSGDISKTISTKNTDYQLQSNTSLPRVASRNSVVSQYRSLTKAPPNSYPQEDLSGQSGQYTDPVEAAESVGLIDDQTQQDVRSVTGKKERRISQGSIRSTKSAKSQNSLKEGPLFLGIEPNADFLSHGNPAPLTLENHPKLALAAEDIDKANQAPLQRANTFGSVRETVPSHTSSHQKSTSRTQSVGSASQIFDAQDAQDARSSKGLSRPLSHEASTVRPSSMKRPSSIKIPTTERGLSAPSSAKTPSSARHLLWTDSSSAGLKGLYSNSITLPKDKGPDSPTSPVRLARTLRRITTGGSKPSSRQGSRASSQNPTDRRDERGYEDADSSYF